MDWIIWALVAWNVVLTISLFRVWGRAIEQVKAHYGWNKNFIEGVDSRGWETARELRTLMDYLQIEWKNQSNRILVKRNPEKGKARES